MIDEHLKFAKRLSTLFDTKFSFLGFRFGLDPIIGLIPVFGDIFPIALSTYLIWIAYKLGLPREKLSKMFGYAVLDVAAGFLPFIGDFTDIIIKSHSRSMNIIDEYLAGFESRVLEGEKINH